MNKIPVSAAILTLNSGKTLRRCLESVKDFDDIYILDGNSTDDTLAIAREFSIPVYKQYDTKEKNVRIKNFTEIRIKADSLRRHDWIFWVDSDEHASAELAGGIRTILAGNPDVKTAYYAVKKMVMGDRVIEYSFNEAPYTMRLYNTRSGIVWKGAKVVHEKLFFPEDIKIVNLPYPCYSHFMPSYRQAVKKDDYYLSLVRQKIFQKDGRAKSKKIIALAAIKNFLRAGYIAYKSLRMYIRHGFAQSLPIRHVWRYVRYHLIISYYRLRELFE